MYIGIDYGSKRVGVAYSDPDGKLAFPHAAFPADEALRAVDVFAKGRTVQTIVIGDSLDLSGAPNPIHKRAERFAEQLRGLGYTVKFVDERFTSVQAGRAVGKENIDAAAASLILQSYLDSLR